MISINVTPTDITRMRFAFSPLLEVVASFQMLKKSNPYPTQYLPWIEEAQRALHDIELPYMSQMIGARSYIPDFLTPTPTAPGIDFEEELSRLCETPTAIVEEHIRFMLELDEESDFLKHALIHPRQTVDALVAELRLYWDRTLAHHWSRMIAILENDVLYRAREQALFGASEMLNGLHPRLAYEDGKIHIKKKRSGFKANSKHWCIYDYDITGRGLQIVPVIFSFPRLYWQISPDYQPMLIYGARGTGLWHYNEPDDPEEALQITLGVGRSRVLYALTTPRSTGELAYILDITSGAVSQHLSKLNQAGLVESSRSGRRVFYRLSQRGQSLIQLFS